MKKIIFYTLLSGFITIGTACSEKNDSTQTQSSADAVQTSGTQSTQQAQDAEVTIVKYSDYQCPACAYYVPFEKQLKEDFGDDVEIITKHFPLPQHSYAGLAARAVEAARVQGKYQEMHDLIFAGQQQWSRGNAEQIFVSYAESVGLDLEKFRADMQSAEMNRRVMSDRREGREKGVTSTPTYFVNGQKINHPNNYPAFKAEIEKFMD